MNIRPAEQRPDKTAHRIHWNQTWEQDLELTYRAGYLPPRNADPKLQKLIASVLPPKGHQSIAELREARDICALQTDVAQYALGCLIYDGFERKWMAAPSARREELVLEGLCLAAGAAPFMEEYRKWCPELTLRTLAHEYGGQGYLDLLMEHMPDEIGQEVTTPVLVRHAGVERFLAVESMSMIAPRLRLHRAYFMTLTLWQILLTFVRVLRTPLGLDLPFDVLSLCLARRHGEIPGY